MPPNPKRFKSSEISKSTQSPSTKHEQLTQPNSLGICDPGPSGVSISSPFNYQRGSSSSSMLDTTISPIIVDYRSLAEEQESRELDIFSPSFIRDTMNTPERSSASVTREMSPSYPSILRDSYSSARQRYIFTSSEYLERRYPILSTPDRSPTSDTRELDPFYPSIIRNTFRFQEIQEGRELDSNNSPFMLDVARSFPFPPPVDRPGSREYINRSIMRNTLRSNEPEVVDLTNEDSEVFLSPHLISNISSQQYPRPVIPDNSASSPADFFAGTDSESLSEGLCPFESLPLSDREEDEMPRNSDNQINERRSRSPILVDLTLSDDESSVSHIQRNPNIETHSDTEMEEDQEREDDEESENWNGTISTLHRRFLEQQIHLREILSNFSLALRRSTTRLIRDNIQHNSNFFSDSPLHSSQLRLSIAGLNQRLVPEGATPSLIARVTRSGQYKRFKKEEHCQICMSTIEEQSLVRRLVCMHLFHLACVDKWLNSKKNCPLCRVNIDAAAEDLLLHS